MSEVNDALVRSVFERARFVQHLGIELVSVEYGRCETRIVLGEELQQQHGFAHAGVLMTLADHTCGGAAASTVPAGQDVITVDNSCSFLRPAVATLLMCRATVIRTGKSLVFVEAQVEIERDGIAIPCVKMLSTLAVIPLG